MEHIERHVTLPTDTTEAWGLLTAPDDLGAWLGGEVTFEPAAGAAGELVEHDGTRRRVVVDHVDEGRSLSWHWWTDDDRADASRVEITLTPASEGTRVTVVERPLTRTAPAQASASAGAGGAWSHRLLHLELLVLLAAAAVTR